MVKSAHSLGPTLYTLYGPDAEGLRPDAWRVPDRDFTTEFRVLRLSPMPLFPRADCISSCPSPVPDPIVMVRVESNCENQAKSNYRWDLYARKVSIIVFDPWLSQPLFLCFKSDLHDVDFVRAQCVAS